MRTRIRALATITAAAAIALTAIAATPAHATTGPVYSGYGWQINTARGIYSLDPSKPFTFVFANTSARSRLTPYLTGPAAQFTSVTGIKAAVSTTIDTTPRSTCPARGRIVVHLEYRPGGTKGMSLALACHASDGSAWGGHILIDSEYWYAGYAITEARRKNAVTHEFGHMFLNHPNYDRDKDGAVEWYECDKTAYGYLPVMCSPGGGYTSSTGSGKFTSIDTPGLAQAVKNFGLGQQ